MFGYVMANADELTKEEKQRYTALYCGICRQIRQDSGQAARMALSYDLTFLAMLLMSLYEPEETAGDNACSLHPIRKRAWVQSEYTRYCADMNVALAYYKALDDCEDDGKLTAKAAAKVFSKDLDRIRREYPRQCDAMEDCLSRLSQLEQENCENPDLPAGCFGKLMEELFVWQQDLWEPYLRQMGMALGRFIYLADAIQDYDADKKKSRYNPLLAMDTGEDRCRWDTYLVLAMGRCTEAFEKLPLVQDKDILDNILYSGVWCSFRRKKKQEDGL